MAAVVLMEDPDTDPAPLLTHGNLGEVWRPNWVIDPDTGLPVWSGTWEVRENSRRNFMSSIDNLLINRIRAVAEVWHNVLDDATRAIWKLNEATHDGARPDQDKNLANGWNLFAEMALAPIAWSAGCDGYFATDNPQDPDILTFDTASSGSLALQFTAGFSEPPFSDEYMFAFIHQVDPLHVDKRDADRRTICIGYYQFLHAPAPSQQFTANAVFPFNSGDKVQVLIRLHKSLNGVTNILLSCTAT